MQKQKPLHKLIINPKQIFFIDALGALITLFLLLGILAQFEQYFGMPKRIIYILSGTAFFLFTYSVCCHLLIKSNWKPFLRILIICNLLYSLLSILLIIKHSGKITELGLIYFILELIVIGIIVIIEYKSYSYLK